MKDGSNNLIAYGGNIRGAVNRSDSEIRRRLQRLQIRPALRVSRPPRNGTAGSYIVTASVVGIAMQHSFNLTNTSGTSGLNSGQEDQLRRRKLRRPLQVPLERLGKKILRVIQSPVSSSPLLFHRLGASATLSTLTATTNAFGVASVTATANATSGAYAVTATAVRIADAR